MNKDLVVVESNSINNESVAITINVAEIKQGGVVDRREISRSFIFEDFQSTMPLGMAEILLKRNPDQYRILGPADGNMTKAIEDAMNGKLSNNKTKDKPKAKRKRKSKKKTVKKVSAPKQNKTSEKKESTTDVTQE